MKIFVTGGTGRLGQYFVKATMKKGWGITLLVRDPEKAREEFKALDGDKKISLVKGDILETSQDVLAEGMKECDAVVHLAAVVNYTLPREKVMKVNAHGTERILSATKKAGVKRFVQMSSTSIYHHPPYLPIDEKQTPTPVEAYGRSKLAAEQAVKASSVPYVIIRAPAIYGTGFEEGFLNIVERIRKGNMVVVGSGKNRVPLIHAADVANALVLAVEKKEALNDDFIIANDELLTQEQCLDAVADALNAKKPSTRVPVWLAYAFAWLSETKAKLLGKKPSLVKEYVSFLAEDRAFDTGKARKLLGFRQTIAFEDGLNEVITAFLAKEKNR